jgi:signal transduction histidine kinase/CheY-like chemotaxis protein
MGQDAMKRLVSVVQELSLARSLETIMDVVRRAARDLSAADGASFILRDNGQCFYAEEDAIGPLWKGQRFPMEACVSGWSMLHRKALAIEDIYVDPRVPHEAYRPTFVKSLLMVPIRTQDPIGAIGVYWAQNHRPTETEVEVLAALADTVSVAIQNVELNRALEQRVQDLEEANRMKDDFLMTVSHELRTPLNGILGWAEILSSGQAELSDYDIGLDTIARNSEGLNRLIDDLLDTSRMMTGRLSFAKNSLNPTDFIRPAMESVAMAVAAKNITMEFTETQGVGTIVGDAVRLQQVVWNLLNNAIKFTPEGGRIQVILDRAQGSARITVRDSGEGVAPDILPFIFDRFRQANSTTIRKHGGLGLGLALVRYLVEAHGGTIAATSEGVGQGASFTVSLPLQAIAEPAITEPCAAVSAQDKSNPKAEAEALAGWRVLVVDDVEDARLLVTHIVKNQGAVVAQAADASNVLNLIENFKPDVLLCDLCMPGEDGYSLMRRIRSTARDHSARLPAIAVTAYADQTSQAHARASGFDGVVSKPLLPRKFVKTILDICGEGT